MTGSCAGGCDPNAPTSCRRDKVRARQGVTLGLVLVGTVLLAATTPAFATRANLTAVALGMSLDAIVAVGMTVPIVSGGFDLSVGAVMALSGAVAALVAAWGGDR